MSKNCIFENPAVEHEGFSFPAAFRSGQVARPPHVSKKNAAPTAIQKVNPVEVSYILGYPDSWMVVMEYPIKMEDEVRYPHDLGNPQ